MFKFIKNFFKNLKLNKHKAISKEVESNLENVDWSYKDVLVGTVRTDEQLRYNIGGLCYYAPAKYISNSQFPIRYVALYEGDLKNTNGIRYYGKITDILKVRRNEIPVSRNKNNGDELYYFFKVERWDMLKNPITVKATVGGAPAFTNMFLLQNSTFTYQLFCINSPSQFKLMYNLILENKHEYKVNKIYSLKFSDRDILIINNIKKINEKIPVLELREKPLETFEKIKEIVY